MRLEKTAVLGIAAAAVIAGSCANTVKREMVKPTELSKLNPESTYLKAHMKSGHILILTKWHVDEPAGTVTGVGDHFDDKRDLVKTGSLTLNVAEVALFETNVEQTSGAVAALSVMTGISAAVTVACLTNPKACFGSCPTFYASDGHGRPLMAEGFSASVSPSLEDDDVDVLHGAVVPPSGELVLTMTNEALETHVVRRADVLAVPRPRNGRVFADDAGTFWVASAVSAPTSCRSDVGDCTAKVARFDHTMWFSVADAHDLATKEVVDIDFGSATRARARSRLGVVISARQTFLSTYLFYQALSYMGRSATEFLAALERGGERQLAQAQGVYQLLGGIDVQIERGGQWHTVGSYHETGPLATDEKIIMLPADYRGEPIRLHLTKGHWRLDQIGLASVVGSALPVRVQPHRAMPAGKPRVGKPGDASAALRDPKRQLVTGPGDSYQLHYKLPAPGQGGLELFLDTRGYYLEWMRAEWIEEQDLGRAAVLLTRPDVALRELAPAFKKIEPTIEDMFWRSRYVAPSSK